MLHIDKSGRIINSKVKLEIHLSIQKRLMKKVSGLIVHQTNSPTAQSTFNGYKQGLSGAHFLIDKDGTIYQTASVHYQTWHVGKLKARCLVELTCTPKEIKALKTFNPTLEHKAEMQKNVPDRYPANHDSIGIEIVGMAIQGNNPNEEAVYEEVTEEQNASLKWLVNELSLYFGFPKSEVFRHPTVSRKTSSEAATAAW
ncbi:MAG: peptidoglycan recognition family protein [Pseudomonadota bacterium]|nr:peptidoglycan recognition family protein [Pseudomonadota bacterium]